jgi:hypothetical protein
MLKMKMPLENLKSLRDDMKAKKWIITSFLFDYKKEGYIVLVHRYRGREHKPKYALVRLEFLRKNNIEDNFIVHANAQKFLNVDPGAFRIYFGIEYNPNFGILIQQFYEQFAQFIPENVQEKPSPQEKDAMLKSLNKSDPEDPNKKYCYMVRRNPPRENGEPGQRSDFNDNKTRLRRPKLYEKLKDESSVSFCYSDLESDEKTDEEILQNWAANQHER